MMLAADEFFANAQYGEALLWLLVAAAFAYYATLNRGAVRKRCQIALVAFALFGLSDIVEAQTGAWWRPWWLALWKGGCVAAMVWLLIDDFRRKKSGP